MKGLKSLNRAQKILKIAQKYNNSDDLLMSMFGIPSDEPMDLYVIAPSWTPEKILKNYEYEVEPKFKHAYVSSYVVKFAGYRIGWIQCASSSANLLDSMLMLANVSTDKIVFMGAVGALRKEIPLGELSTPAESYAYVGGNAFLKEKLSQGQFGETIRPYDMNFVDQVIERAEKQDIKMVKRKVFCTDSIICEYSHLDEILATGAELIEMETSAFYEGIRLMEKRGIALLCVSDNSAAGIALVNRSEEEKKYYHNCRQTWIPELLKIICEMD